MTTGLSGLYAPARKAYTEGTHRVVEPAVTVSRALRLAPAMGITRAANITGLDSVGIPVVMVCRPNSRSLAVSQGKGLTLEDAKASAIMESVELYHAEHITQPLKLASYEELRYTHVLIDEKTLPRTSISLFNPTLRLLWIAGRDLMHEEVVWVPHELVHTDYTLPFPPGSGCFSFSSNGLASGNHLLEAISHGICELVERDATTLWHLKSEALQAKTRVDLGSVSDEACRSMLNRYADADIEVAVWETTTDIGIASFLCTIFDAESAFRPLYPTSGMGCHPARDVALLRALTEAAQSRLTLIAGSRDDAIRGRYEEALDRDAIRALRGAIAREAATRNISDAPNWEAETLDEDVDWELGRLAAVGVERVVVVDLTKSELSLPVVRVVAPELEGSDRVPGYLPGARGQAALNHNR